MPQPVEIATTHTVDFVAEWVAAPATILEIGCGAGEVAAALGSRGHEVLAIDSDQERVQIARHNGVRARCASFPDYSCLPVDVVLFTRSLHHLRDLAAALRQARQLLRPGGQLLVEDFDYTGAGADTLEWFADRVRRLVVDAEAIRADPFLAALAGSTDPFAVWQAEHDHDTHDIDTLATGVADIFGEPARVATPYLFRYLIPTLPRDSGSAAQVNRFLADEQAAIDQGAIRAVGQRLRATRGSAGGGRT